MTRCLRDWDSAIASLGVLRRLYRLSDGLPLEATAGPSPRDASRVRSLTPHKRGSPERGTRLGSGLVVAVQ